MTHSLRSRKRSRYNATILIDGDEKFYEYIKEKIRIAAIEYNRENDEKMSFEITLSSWEPQLYEPVQVYQHIP